ncbi:MAG: polyprenyl synthetase family protein [Verrucomicrobia bacterium]|nr:polyprenyl synthetase family protein [Verrucomicrobiota bacterium]
MTTETINRSSFFLLRDKIEKEIARSILSFGEKTKLRDACEYALLSGGKRLRPIIVMMVSEGLGHDLDVAPAALAVEFLHTASLVADDLPCMDNDDERREKPSLHKAYGESVALLTSYSLIFAGYEKLHENCTVMKQADPPFSGFAETVCCIALEHASRAAGILGATSGQFLDLYPPNHSLELLKEILYKKTVTLFETAFVFGWLFGGGMIAQLDLVKKAAYHFGMAFQIADDLGDIAQDEKNQREINAASLLGKERSYSVFQKEMESFKELLIELNINTPSFEKMCHMLSKAALAYSS